MITTTPMQLQGLNRVLDHYADPKTPVSVHKAKGREGSQYIEVTLRKQKFRIDTDGRIEMFEGWREVQV